MRYHKRVALGSIGWGKVMRGRESRHMLNLPVALTINIFSYSGNIFESRNEFNMSIWEFKILVRLWIEFCQLL
jgi:hypothetical protein